jgi:glycosyltransferase involved in cell wall biosynthesis
MSLTITVCIATHERTHLLAATLQALGAQTRAPEEVIVSDSSRNGAADLVRRFAVEHPAIAVQYVPSSRKALPWQRWWAFKHSKGQVVLFLDDDVCLVPPALETLDRAYDSLSSRSSEPIAGIGFWIAYDDGSRPGRRLKSLRERWLGLSGLRGGSLTRGGLAVSLAGFPIDEPVEVDVLWGGAMSFRREAIDEGPLDHLVSLYEKGIGRGEDAVVSSGARRSGKLFVLAEPYAVHPAGEVTVPTPYAKDGWRLGMTQTFGRAHTMRWMARDWSAYKKDWWRFVALELGRCLAGIVRRPLRFSSWLHFGGAFFGTVLTLIRWKRIPASESSRRDPFASPAPA